MKRDLLLAAVIVSAGAVISGVSIAQIATKRQHLAQDVAQDVAQATHPLQSTPGAESKPSEPASGSGTTGARPTDIPPQPARPDADAQKAGATPALPPAPAEKSAAPIPAK